MKNFVKLQNHIQEFLLHEDQSIFKDVVSTQKVAVEIRLAIYKNAYQSRLQQALATNYPILHTYMGDEQFEKLAIAYINQFPSSFASIRWFGDQLALFLKNSVDWQSFPYLAELAEFEWNCGLVFDGLNAPILQVEDMGSIPPEAWSTMKFKVHPTVRYLNLRWNVVAIWQALADDKVPEHPEKSPAPVGWILWRNNLACRFSSLVEDEAWALKAILNGSTFGELCEGIGCWYEEQEAGQRAASLLKKWIIDGLIEAVVF